MGIIIQANGHEWTEEGVCKFCHMTKADILARPHEHCTRQAMHTISDMPAQTKLPR